VMTSKERSSSLGTEASPRDPDGEHRSAHAARSANSSE
jgi:hypothetical protein